MRVAILGGGFMGEVHFRAWSRLQEHGVEIAGVADVRGTAGLSWLHGAGVTVWDRPEAALAEPGIDIVDVCLPTPLHRAVIEQAAAAGRAILCEKPLALTPEEAEAAVTAARRHEVPFMVAHVVRFFPDYRRARELALEGAIGQPRSARCFRGGALPAWNSWMHDPAQSGGVLLDGLIHDIDYLRWVFGPVARVHAQAAVVGTDGRQHATAILRFENDAIAMVEGAWSYPPGSPFHTEAEIAGTAGLIQWSSQATQSLRVYTRQGAEAEARLPASPLDPDPYQLEIAHFLEHIRHRVPLAITPEDAVAAVRVASAAARSAAEGKPVEVHA